MKTKILNPFTWIIVLFLTVSCKVEPEAIEYGKDQCGFCKMNIVDKTHSAQYVTSKGKQFKFDSIECLVNSIKDVNKDDIAILLVANFGNPGEMIDAKTAIYLISNGIKSPMGANLSAFSLKQVAEEYLLKYDGIIYSWEALNQKFSDQ